MPRVYIAISLIIVLYTDKDAPLLIKALCFRRALHLVDAKEHDIVSPVNVRFGHLLLIGIASRVSWPAVGAY
jgi:hypothetical protein